jgi:hypothetical protein
MHSKTGFPAQPVDAQSTSLSVGSRQNQSINKTRLFMGAFCLWKHIMGHLCKSSSKKDDCTKPELPQKHG